MDGEAVASRSGERRGLWIWSAGAASASGLIQCRRQAWLPLIQVVSVGFAILCWLQGLRSRLAATRLTRRGDSRGPVVA